MNFTYPFGVHIAEVEVDTETGETTITRYLAVDDCGNVINPMIVDGQVHGGVAQGVAQALWEEVVYDSDGQLITGTLMDYAVPFSSDLPSFETGATITPSPVNPLGVKGVGEAGTIASTPVIVNAVIDALSGLGDRAHRYASAARESVACFARILNFELLNFELIGTNSKLSNSKFRIQRRRMM